jgi:DNA-binding response OmpR family regulator
VRQPFRVTVVPSTAEHIPIRRTVARPRSGGRSALQTITAQLQLSPGALVRLLSISGRQSQFVLSAVDGTLTVHVGLAVSRVPDSELAIGASGMVLDWSRSTIALRSNRARLTRMELRLLVALLEYAPGVAPAKELVRILWEGSGVPRQRGMAALPVWVCALRRRLASIGAPDAIRTVRRVGYSLRA